MAQLTEQEKRQFQARGLWVRERCDREGCRNAIGMLVWRSKTGSGRVYCTNTCRDVAEPGGVRVRKARQQIAAAPASDMKVAAGFDSYEQVILSVMQEHKREGFPTTRLIQMCRELGVSGGGNKFRQAIVNLVARNAIQPSGRNFVLALSSHNTGNGAKPKAALTVGLGNANKLYATQQSRQHKNVKMRDVPTEED